MQTEKGEPTIYLEDLLDIMYRRSVRNNDPSMSVSSLVQATISFVRHTPSRFPDPELRNVPTKIIKLLIFAEESGEVMLTREGSAIIRVYFSGYFTRRLRERLNEIRKEPEAPFPTASSLALEVPPKMTITVRVQDELINFLDEQNTETEEEADDHETRIVLLAFSADVDPLLLPYPLNSQDLTLVCLQKIRFYLRNERNQAYMRQKMLGIFRHREKVVEETFTAILTRPEAILRDIWNPSEFAYYFWVQVTASILKEYSEKKEKTINEQNFVQAATLLSMLLAHRKSLIQRNNDREQALKQLESKLREHPHLHTLNNIFEFTDKNGVPLTKKIGHQDVIKYIEQQEVPEPGSRIPPLVRINPRDAHPEYVRKDLLLMVFFQHIREVREKLAKAIVKDWSNALHVGIRLVEMQNHEAFEAEIEAKLQELDPTLSAMLDFSLIYFASREVPISEQIKSELKKILDSKALELKPLSDIFDLDRDSLYADAKLLLPVWKTILGLSTFIRFLQRMFVGVDREEEAERIRLQERNQAKLRKYVKKRKQLPAPSMPRKPVPAEKNRKRSKGEPDQQQPRSNADTTSRRESVRKTVEELQDSYSRGYANPEEARHAAQERWNTIIDRKNRRNLTIDVENLAKDRARKLLQKRGSLPTMEHIDEVAETLARKDVFENIRDKKSLKQFIALTIAKHLGHNLAK